MGTTLGSSWSIGQIVRSLGRAADPDARGRRGSVRRPVNISILFEGNLQGEAWVLNLSAGGIRIVCDERLNLGELVSFSVAPGSLGPSLTGHAVAVWAKQCPDGFVTGLCFTEPH